MRWERCVSRILPNIGGPAHHLSSKAIPEVQHSRKTEKEIQVNFPPIEESGPRENGRGRGGAPAIIPNPTFFQPFSTQAWLDAPLRMNWNF